MVEETINAMGIPTEQMSLGEMPYGDYVWSDVDGNTVCVERKRILDLLGSLQSGRLEEQLSGCLEEYSKVVLLKEGVVYPKSDGSMVVYEWGDKGVLMPRFYHHVPYPLTRPYVMVPSLLFRLQALGIDIMESYSARHSGVVIGALYNNTQKKEHMVLRRYIRKKPVLLKPDHDVEVLLAVAKVGNVRLTVEAARGLIEKFGTPMKVFKGEPKKWCEVKGVGPKVARGLEEVLKK